VDFGVGLTKSPRGREMDCCHVESCVEQVAELRIGIGLRPE